MENPFRNLPSVNDLLETPVLKKVVASVSHNVVVDNVRNFLDDMRSRLKSKSEGFNVPTPNEMAKSIASWISREDQPKLQPVINGTGVILHTGLGRAPLAKDAIDAISAISAGFASVEVDLESGERSQRVQAVEKLLCELTGAEAAAITNNNAGATLVTLAAISGARETIVSRGELIEIGGSFRLPEIMGSSGSTLRDVGTTNKTRISDYADACDETTGALMKVHTSNYAVCGFTESVSLEELVALSRKNQIPVIDDVGSGALVDFSKYGLTGEPLVPESIRRGADLVLFSGDKLVGGPQCGIIVGKKKLVSKIASHPLMRALRVDKMTLAALAATLRLYRDPDVATTQIPILQMVSTSLENLNNRADRIIPRLEPNPQLAKIEAAPAQATLGGGSIPNQTIESVALAMHPKSMSVDQFTRKLRLANPSIFARVQNDTCFLDLRTLLPSQDRLVVESINQLGTS